MSVIGSNILAGASGQGGGYNLTKSLRFRRSASAYLNRTFGTPTNNKLFTWSGWVKRSEIGVWNDLFGVGGSNGFGFNTAWNDNGLAFFTNNISGDYFYLVTTQVFRDPSAWYHIVLAVDTTQATASNRAKIYVNGVQITAFNSAVYQSQNSSLTYNSATTHYLCSLDGSIRYFDGYLAEVNFVDGQALTPSSFGETSTSTGVWIPKKYTGTYGTNGFYLPFTDTTSTSTLGTDFSGNSNTWTVNNISLTSGSTYDSMTDVPTLTSATTANYAVLSPIASSPLISLTNGNLTAGGTDEASLIGTIGVNSGKWYWEVTLTSGSVTPYLGVSSNSFDKSGSGSNYLLAGISWYGNGLKKAYTGTSSTSATSNTTGVYGFALDISAGTLAYYFNNSLVFTDTTIPTSGVTLFPLVAHTNSGSASWNPANFNFGQQPFAYTPPTGFVALNTFNLPTPTIGATASTQANKYFDVSLYTGTGATQTITNSGSMQPDFVWTKSRANAYNNNLYDSVRGNTQILQSNNTTAEATATTAFSLVSFNSNGYAVGASENSNLSGTSVGWQWRANGTPAVTNTAGSITSTVSANTTAGFSIVTYTGTGANATVGHGLGVAPSMVIVKNRGGSYSWLVYHKFMATSSPATWYMSLNSTSAASNGANVWIDDPTSTVFTVSGSYPEVNGSTNTYVAYCFAPVAGYSAFGSYTGNGSSDGSFIYTGFRPRFVMIKRTDNVGNWYMLDTSRDPYNLVTQKLMADLSAAENGNGESTSTNTLDILSNGFKMRSTNTASNTSGGTYIYMAFAEVPQKFALGR